MRTRRRAGASELLRAPRALANVDVHIAHKRGCLAKEGDNLEARILSPGDEELLAAAAAICEEDNDPGPARCRQLLADPCFVAAVALDGGQPVGLAYGHVLLQISRTALLIYSVDTDGGHRRQGAATAMIDALRRLSIERGYYEMWVLTSATNALAMRLYASCGGVRETCDDVMWVFPLESSSAA